MLLALDHVTVRSTDLERSVAFYQRLLGLEPGPRPAFGLAGAWLYAQGRPVLHLIERPVEGAGGVIDHLAFEARGRLALMARLGAAGVPCQLVALPDGSALQMFVHDPDGARLELVFKEPDDR